MGAITKRRTDEEVLAMRDQVADLAQKARGELRVPMAERLDGLVMMLDWSLGNAERFITEDGLRLPS